MWTEMTAVGEEDDKICSRGAEGAQRIRRMHISSESPQLWRCHVRAIVLLPSCRQARPTGSLGSTAVSLSRLLTLAHGVVCVLACVRVMSVCEETVHVQRCPFTQQKRSTARTGQGRAGTGRARARREGRNSVSSSITIRA